MSIPVLGPEDAAKTVLRALEGNPSANETARRELFIAHIIALFPKYALQIQEYAHGAEKRVRMPALEKEDAVVGRIDTKKGSLVIEYKTRIRTKAEQQAAEEQLKKYIAGIANCEGKEAVTKGISTDIINWYEYKIEISPGATPKAISTGDVNLSDKRSYAFSSGAPKEFVETVERLVFEEVPIIATARIVLNEFGLHSPSYEEFHDKMKEIWDCSKDKTEVKLGLNLWSTFIMNCFDQSAKPDEDNYLDHAYLVILSRLIAGYAISTVEEQDEPDFSLHCINGEFFQSGSHRVKNFVEEDFFRWIKDDEILSQIGPALKSLQRKLQWLDFRAARKMSLLSGIYAEIMPPEQKAEYGEVFTPSWLTDMIISSIEGVEKENVRFLDPACGTGNFLRSTISRKIEYLSGKYPKPKVLEIVLGQICGLDINPISVVIAKTTVMLALSELLKDSEYPVELPIYLCDSLFLPKMSVTSTSKTTTIILDSEEIKLPIRILAAGTALFDNLIQVVGSLAKDVSQETVSEITGKEALKSRVREKLIEQKFADQEQRETITGLEKIFDVLLYRINKKRNNVWIFVLKNTYRPSMLLGKFDLIASNPPWLAMSSFPSAKYKEELESLIKDYELTPEGASKHHIEISTIFAIYCANAYLKREGQFAYVLPRVIMNGFQHEPLRRSRFLNKAPLSISCFWDLMDVAPLFKRPACVVLGSKEPKAKGFPQVMPCLRFEGNPSSLRCDESKLTLTTLGDKSSYSYSKKVQLKEYEKYKNDFKQGADIMPRRAVIVDILNRIDSPVLSIQTSRVETENRQNKAPFDQITLRGNIERQYVFNTMKSNAILPFVAGKAVYAALPVETDENTYRILEIGRFVKAGHDYAKSWFQRVNKILTGLCGKELGSWLARRNKLIDQSPEPWKFYVLYGAGGTNITSTAIDTGTLEFPFVNDQTLYAWKAPSEDEAWFVVGMLNSDLINNAIKSKQPVGAFGEQHVHQLPLSLIPDFDSKEPQHVKLAIEGKRIHEVAERIVQEDPTLLDSSKSLASRRKRFAIKIKPELEKLDFLVESILGISDEK